MDQAHQNTKRHQAAQSGEEWIEVSIASETKLFGAAVLASVALVLFFCFAAPADATEPGVSRPAGPLAQAIRRADTYYQQREDPG
ncbi:MAG: hypothetical protein ACRD1J_02900, partial [Terriglobia bacterium]